MSNVVEIQKPASASVARNVSKRPLIEKVLPIPGEIYEKDGRERVVVAVNPQGDSPKDCFVEWCRPSCDMRSWTVWLPSWHRWAAAAKLKSA